MKLHMQLVQKFKKVKAIIAVHMQGYPCNLKELKKIADDYMYLALYQRILE